MSVEATITDFSTDARASDFEDIETQTSDFLEIEATPTDFATQATITDTPGA